MTSTTISFSVDAAERQELAARAAREKISLSDYIRVRLGLRADGSLDDDARARRSRRRRASAARRP